MAEGPHPCGPFGVQAHLADDFDAVLVDPQAQEARVAQAAVAGPFGEAELGDELRLDPGDVAEARRVVERGVVARAAARSCDASSRSVVAVEAGADLAGVVQAAVVVDADEQRAELRRASPAAA